MDGALGWLTGQWTNLPCVENGQQLYSAIALSADQASGVKLVKPCVMTVGGVEALPCVCFAAPISAVHYIELGDWRGRGY